MEAAINNAGVVYHSDPRLIFAYLVAGEAGGSSLLLSLSLSLSLCLTSCPRSFHLPS